MSKAAELAALIGSQSALSNRNLIINGAMQVSQRGTSAVTVGAGSFLIDRFKTYSATDGAYTIEQSTDAPDGFTTSLKAQVTTADTSIAAGQYAYWPYYIEARDLQHLSYGTSSAKTITLSFFVKSSKTGVYTIALYKSDSTACIFTHEYTISSANTWEKKTITISPTAGSTSFVTSSGGSIVNGNQVGLQVTFNLSFGSDFTGGTSNSWAGNATAYSTTNAVNWMDSTSNNFYLTGVQLELGETATPFEHRSYGDELARCQRYYYQLVQGSYMIVGMNDSTSNCETTFGLPVEMRVDPTLGTSGTPSQYTIRQNGSNITCDGGPTILGSGGKNVVGIRFSKSGALNTSYASYCFGNTSGADLKLDAEL